MLFAGAHIHNFPLFTNGERKHFINNAGFELHIYSPHLNYRQSYRLCYQLLRCFSLFSLPNWTLTEKFDPLLLGLVISFKYEYSQHLRYIPKEVLT